MDAYVDETWRSHIEKILGVASDYRHTFEQTHSRVHYCHRGHGICPICPLPLAIEIICMDAIEWQKTLSKVWKKEFICKEKRKTVNMSKPKFWSLVDIR